MSLKVQADIEDLKLRLATLEAVVEEMKAREFVPVVQRGPGRPPKNKAPTHA